MTAAPDPARLRPLARRLGSQRLAPDPAREHGGGVNHSFDYLDAGPEPSLSDYSDLHRWDKWFAWDRRRTNLMCWKCHERHAIDADGRIRYEPLLRSQRSRAERRRLADPNMNRHVTVRLENGQLASVPHPMTRAERRAAERTRLRSSRRSP